LKTREEEKRATPSKKKVSADGEREGFTRIFRRKKQNTSEEENAFFCVREKKKREREREGRKNARV